MRVVSPLPACDLLELLSKPYIKNKDLKRIACCGENTVKRYREAMLLNLKEKNYYVPSGLIPTEEVIEFFNIDISHLKRGLDIERRLKHD